MILAIDIGNSNATAAVYRTLRGRVSGGPVSRWKVARPPRSGERWWREVAVLACAGAGIHPGELSGSVLSSVVPRATRPAAAALRKLTRRPALVIRGSLPLGIRLAYPDPDALGPDRVCAMVAAVARYGTPVVVVDCGTAVTIDAVGRGKRHAGGLIAPGLAMSVRALGTSTAALPVASWSVPGGAAGRGTEEGIRAGSWYSVVGVIREGTGRLRRLVGRGATVVGTGGDAAALMDSEALFDVVDPDLVTRGAAIALGLTSRRRGVTR